MDEHSLAPPVAESWGAGHSVLPLSCSPGEMSDTSTANSHAFAWKFACDQFIHISVGRHSALKTDRRSIKGNLIMATCITSNTVTFTPALKSTWTGLSLRERADLLGDLVNRQGYSRRAAATLLGISEKLVRDLLDLSELPSHSWADYEQDKIGRKKLVKAAHAHKKRQAKLTAIQQQATHNQQVSKAAKAIEDFVRNELQPDYLWERFFGELASGPVTRDIFHDECPATDELQPLSAAKKVIDQSRPALPPELWERTNQHVRWFAHWSQRVIPDEQIRDEAVNQVRRKLCPGL